jgi:hypothetical protein
MGASRGLVCPGGKTAREVAFGISVAMPGLHGESKRSGP